MLNISNVCIKYENYIYFKKPHTQLAGLKVFVISVGMKGKKHYTTLCTCLWVCYCFFNLFFDILFYLYLELQKQLFC